MNTPCLSCKHLGKEKSSDKYCTYCMQWKWDSPNDLADRRQTALLSAMKSRMRAVNSRSSQPVTSDMLLEQYNIQGGKCSQCEIVLTFAKLQSEHVWSRCEVDRIDVRNDSYVDNLQLMCKSCNMRKGRRDKLEHYKLFRQRQRELLQQPPALLKRVCRYKRCSAILDASTVNQLARGRAICSKHISKEDMADSEWAEEYDAVKHFNTCCRLLSFWFKDHTHQLSVDARCYRCENEPIYTKPVLDSLSKKQVQWICDVCALKTRAHPEAEIGAQLSDARRDIDQLFVVLDKRSLCEKNIVYVFDCEKDQRQRFDTPKPPKRKRQKCESIDINLDIMNETTK
jgi:hypothetical protein